MQFKYGDVEWKEVGVEQPMDIGGFLPRWLIYTDSSIVAS